MRDGALSGAGFGIFISVYGKRSCCTILRHLNFRVSYIFASKEKDGTYLCCCGLCQC